MASRALTGRVLCVLALVLLAMSAPVAGAVAQDQCANPPQPASVKNNTWYCANNSDTVIVFVHGLNSSSSTAWLRPAESGGPETYWPNLVLTDRQFAKPSIFLAGFYTGVTATNYAMSDATEELFTALTSRVDGRRSVLSYKNILFVAHSLGGVITRAVMVRHKEAFRGKRIGLLLVASPSLGSDYADKLVTVASLVHSQLVRQLAPNSPFLVQLDRDFVRLMKSREFRDSLAGGELVENYFIGAAATDSSLLGMTRTLILKSFMSRVVEEGSASRYFPLNKVVVPGSDHFTIAQPSGLNDLSHARLADVYQRMKALDTPACEPPPGFAVDLSLKRAEQVPAPPRTASNAEVPSLTVKRLDPTGRYTIGQADFATQDQMTGRHAFSPRLPFPCPGDLFRARLIRFLATAELRSAQLPPTSLCFRRSQSRLNDRFARLSCQEGARCEVERTAGLAEPCRQTGWNWPQRWPWPLVATAKAQASSAAKVWAVPSIQSLAHLPARIRPGYSEFFVTSEPLKRLSDATHFSYALRVNGVPVLIDGQPAHEDLTPFNGAGGVRLRFALENLGFSGGKDGHEKIELEMKFWRDGKVLRTVRLQRPYVSYRHAPAMAVKDEASAEVFRWSGYYRPSELVDRFELLVATAFNVGEIQDSKRTLDGRAGPFDGQRIVGVIRPPRKDGNGAYGVALGLQRPSGQVKSSFTRAEADKLCEWIWSARSKLPQWMKRATYLYEFPVSAFTEKTDRGKYRGYCPQRN